MVGRQVLAELAADDDTQVLDLADMVVDDTPKPAQAEGLAPVRSQLTAAVTQQAERMREAWRASELDAPVMHKDDKTLRFEPRGDQMWANFYTEDNDPMGTTVHRQPWTVPGIVMHWEDRGWVQEPTDAEIPVPSLPFLNAGAVEPDPEPVRPYVTVGNALPAELTAWELDLLHRPVGEILGDPDDMPTQSLPAVREPEQLPRPPQRDEQHLLVFSVFDRGFWRDRSEEVRREETAAAEREAANDRRAEALTGRLTALELGHWEHIARVAPVEYAERLANSADIARAARPALQLPRRTPGAALAAIEASAGELVDA
jgi:hypothetical protein